MYVGQWEQIIAAAIPAATAIYAARQAAKMKPAAPPPPPPPPPPRVEVVETAPVVPSWVWPLAIAGVGATGLVAVLLLAGGRKK